MTLGERSVSNLRAFQIPRAGIARTYQTTQLFETHVGHRQRLDRAAARQLGAISLAGKRDAENAAIAESLLAFVGYTGALEQPAGALSHVDKRFVEIARALAIRPSVLALDEPAAGIERRRQRGHWHVLRKLAAAGMP